MDAVEMTFPVLDIVIAAMLSAWFLAFTTASRADDATARMVARAERVRLGALAFTFGLFTDVASLAYEMMGFETVAVVLAFCAYPIWIGGAVALASATWAERGATAEEATAWTR